MECRGWPREVEQKLVLGDLTWLQIEIECRRHSKLTREGNCCDPMGGAVVGRCPLESPG